MELQKLCKINLILLANCEFSYKKETTYYTHISLITYIIITLWNDDQRGNVKNNDIILYIYTKYKIYSIGTIANR